MKRVVILHGTSVNHTANWFSWLGAELEKLGCKVWLPDLPNSERPNIEKYNDFLFSSNWDFNDNLIIGHSSGAVAIFGLLEALPKQVKIDTAVMAGAFTKRLSEDPSWEMLQELFERPFDFEAIKKKANKFIFVHSDDDPICPLEQAQELKEKVDGELLVQHGMGHFSARLDPRFTKFPELLDIIKTRVV